MQRKGQAAMEFLMTYGWAILAAIIAIGVLAVFGVFNPGTFVSDAATATAPFGISAHNIIAPDTVNIDMIQSSGNTIQNVTVTVTGTGASSAITCDNSASPVSTWNTGGSQLVALTCSGGTFSAGDNFQGDLSITYNRQGSTLFQQSTGNLRGAAQ